MNVEQAIDILQGEASARSVAYVASRNANEREDAEALFLLARLDAPEWSATSWRVRLAQLDGDKESVAVFAERYRNKIDANNNTTDTTD